MPTPSTQNQSSDSAEWYYQLLGLATGPVSIERLKWLIDQNHLTGATLVGRSQTGPWKRLDESPVAKLVGKAPKADGNKKPVRISSGRRGSSKRLPKIKEKPAPAEDEYVTDGIELDDLEVVEEPTVRKPTRPAPKARSQAPQPAAKPTASKRVPVVEDLEVVSPAPKRDSPKARVAKKRDQQMWYLKVAGAMVGILLVVFVGKMLVGGRDHAADAYILFKGIGDRLEDNSSRMNDVEWNTHLKDSREQVETALEPLREAATSDEPGTQSLVWAGEQLLKMLQGTRLIPREMKAKFDNYMADFAEAPMSDALSPPPTEESQEVDDDSLPVVDDPAFSG